MTTALRDLFASKKFLAALAAGIIYVAGRFGFNVDPTTLDRIFAALLVYVGAQGIADNGKAAALILAPPPPIKPVQSSTGQIGPLATLVFWLVCLGVGFTVMPSCASVRPRVAAATGAFVDCEEPALKAIATEAYGLAEVAILSTVSGDGRHVDTTAFTAALRGLTSDGLRCAVAAAVAALATPPTKPALVMAAPLVVDPGALRAAFARASTELGWATYRTAP